MSKHQDIMNALAILPDQTCVELASALGTSYHNIAKLLTDMCNSGQLNRYRDKKRGPGFFNQYRYRLVNKEPANQWEALLIEARALCDALDRDGFGKTSSLALPGEYDSLRAAIQRIDKRPA